MSWLHARLLITSVQGTGVIATISEIAMRATYGGSNLCTGGTALSDSYASPPRMPSMAYDGLTTTYWASANTPVNHYCGYSFPSPVDVAEVAITCASPSPSTYPKGVTLQGSNDGLVWTNIQSWTIASFPTGSTQTLQVVPQSLDASPAGSAFTAQGYAPILVGDPVFLSPDGDAAIARNTAAIHVPEPVVITGAYGGSALANGNVNTRITVFANLPRPGYVTTSFGGTQDAAYAIGIQSTGRIVIAGRGGDHAMALARYTSYGSPDTSFGDNGVKLIQPFGNDCMARALAIDADDRIIAAGHAYDGVRYRFCIARFLANGDLDSDFGSGGVVTLIIGNRHAKARGVALQPDGKIVVAGYCDRDEISIGPPTMDGEDVSHYSDAVVVRLLASGAIDDSFAVEGIYRLDYYLDGQPHDVSNGQHAYMTDVIVRSDLRIAASGNISSSFGGGEKLINKSFIVVFDPDGSLYELPSANYGRAYLHQPRPHSISLDYGSKIKLTSSEKYLLVGGSYELVYGYVLVNGEYVLDEANPPADGYGRLISETGSFVNHYQALAPYRGLEETVCCGIAPDGKVYIGGYTSSYEVPGATYWRIRLYRFAQSGVADTSYQGDGVVDLEANPGGAPVLRAMLVQPDGGVLLAGWTTADGEQRAMVMRVTVDGIKDSEFGPYDLYVRVAALYDHNASIAQCRTASEMAVDDELQRVLDAIREAANSGCNALLQIDWTLTVPVMDELVYLLEQLDYTVAKTDARFTDYGSVTISWSAAA